ncbi:MAG: hypothetical protein PHT50_07815 [Candidatus Omnitrophica bacterium]|nr:hypothetical protein [Candidatus Omnitrophota bacterium]
MGECPAGYEIKVALGSMACKGCGCQCMIRYLKNEIKNLQGDIDDLNNDVASLK